MQAQPRQCFQLRAAPLHALRQKPLRRRQHRVGVGLAADAPQQAVGLQARAGAARAGGVAAVFGQQHADVHLVGLGLQVVKKALHAVPLLVPLACPTGRPANHPLLLRGAELLPRRIAWNAGGLGVPHQVVLVFLPRRGLQRFDSAAAQGFFVVGNHQAPIDANHPAKALAGLARPGWGVEGEHRRQRLGIAQVAVGAVQAGGEFPNLGRIRVGQAIDIQSASAAFQRHLDGLNHAYFLGVT